MSYVCPGFSGPVRGEHGPGLCQVLATPAPQMRTLRHGDGESIVIDSSEVSGEKRVNTED